MYAKLAWRNIRRSLRDYGIYFLTLVFAVAIFYVFNSLTDQPAFLELRISTRRMAEGAVKTLEWLTVIMTGVVALLVLYANRVIIRKRSRELGTYLLLGMEQGHLACLLLAEVTLIGMAALLTGAVTGIFLSQFFALVVANLFGAEITGHPFIFSPGAVIKTLVTYGLAFLVVGLWQAAALYRQKLIDLINGARQSEPVPLRSRTVSLAAGLLSLLTLGTAYWLADRVSRNPGISPTDPQIWVGAGLGVAGTYLLFLALAGLLIRVRGRMGGWLGRGLNLFLYRQVTSKLNTHSTMLATIALMLTFTICAMGFGLGLGRAVAGRADVEAPFDYLFYTTAPDTAFTPILRLFDQQGLTGRQDLRFRTAASGLRGRDLMLPDDAAWFESADGVAEFAAHVHARVIPFSAYEGLRKLKGYTPVALEGDRYLIHYTGNENTHAGRARQAYGRFLAGGGIANLGGRPLQPASARVLTEPLGDPLSGHAALLVVPDSVAAALPIDLSFLVIQAGQEVPEELDQAATVALAQETPPGGFATAQIRVEHIAQAYMLEGMLLFISFYIGVMFILISATLLALQQVTDAVEHRQRFEVLRKLGADEQMVDTTIARQLGLYFVTPVAIALIHSLVAMSALDRLFALGAGYSTVWSATLATLGIFVVVYGAYYLLSLASCRTLFKEAGSW